jgi:hypothetical protein
MAEVIYLELARRSWMNGPNLSPYRSWGEGREMCDQLHAEEMLAWFRYRHAEEDHGNESTEARQAYEGFLDCFKPRLEATYRLMITPAPDIKALQWKERARAMAGGCAEWDAAIKRDRQRFGDMSK